MPSSDEAFIHIVRTDIDPENSSSLSTAARKLLSIGTGKPSVVEVSGNQMNWPKKLSDAGVAGGRAAVEIHTFPTAANVGPA
jgi:hypothetical protein